MNTFFLIGIGINGGLQNGRIPKKRDNKQDCPSCFKSKFGRNQTGSKERHRK